MIFETDSVPILIYSRPIDMRRAIDGLATVVAERLDHSPTSGTIYVLYNRPGALRCPSDSSRNLLGALDQYQPLQHLLSPVRRLAQIAVSE